MPYVLCFPLRCGFPMLHHLTGTNFDVPGNATGDIENGNISTSDPFKRPSVFPLIIIPCLLIACATVGWGFVYTLRQYDHASCIVSTCDQFLGNCRYRTGLHSLQVCFPPFRITHFSVEDVVRRSWGEEACYSRFNSVRQVGSTCFLLASVS
ncbi:hypothetical protein BKA82DRAFT_627338 [Pisolithus tinctorius]|nr:hypothetical protein BKA82DRAFT_627338 [Pisolithus tinctorius]